MATGPADRVAHPPIHVKPGATVSPTGYSPQQVRHAYGFDQQANDGTGRVVGIVDAFDDPTSASDLQTFINKFGLRSMNGLPNTSPCTVSAGPHPCFQKVFAQAGKPRTNGSWALEISLDVQWAHAIAPGADILLVEARSNSFSNLFGAVSVAASQAQVVSMSWGASDFLGESSFDSFFNVIGVTFTAASGDSGNGVLYPSSSPFVVGVGGTTLPLDAAGTLNGPETAWSGSGGGISANEAEPGYQLNYPIPPTGGNRGSPDVSYDADPASGFSVFDSTAFFGQTGWFQVGGTSAGAPQWAALVALADQSRGTPLSSNNAASSPEYNAAAAAVYVSNYRDITSGMNGTCSNICTASTGYDFVTGLGSPLANNLIPFLASH
jgi:subtilase family serine protease